MFYIPEFVTSEKTDEISDKDYKKNEYERYKNLYEKYADRYYQMTRQSVDKVKVNGNMIKTL